MIDGECLDAIDEAQCVNSNDEFSSITFLAVNLDQPSHLFYQTFANYKAQADSVLFSLSEF